MPTYTGSCSATVTPPVVVIVPPGFPAIIVDAGIGAGILIAAGAVFYTTGAIVYATQRPDPNPAVFGYHEIFHVLVIAAATAHFAAVAIYALPSG